MKNISYFLKGNNLTIMQLFIKIFNLTCRKEKKMEQLIEKAKNGNTEAYTQLVILLQNDLYKIAKTRLNEEADICDAIQETMITRLSTSKKTKRK